MSAQERRLRLAFLLGAITDAFALVPMLSARAAHLLWGFAAQGPPYRFAMGYGAALMLGWTLLLLWAYQRPMERRFVAPLTLVVVAGLVATEIVVVAGGGLEAIRMVPTWIIQAFLSWLFVTGYFGWTSGKPAETS